MQELLESLPEGEERQHCICVGERRDMGKRSMSSANTRENEEVTLNIEAPVGGEMEGDAIRRRITTRWPTRRHTSATFRDDFEENALCGEEAMRSHIECGCKCVRERERWEGNHERARAAHAESDTITGCS